MTGKKIQSIEDLAEISGTAAAELGLKKETSYDDKAKTINPQSVEIKTIMGSPKLNIYKSVLKDKYDSTSWDPREEIVKRNIGFPLKIIYGLLALVGMWITISIVTIKAATPIFFLSIVILILFIALCLYHFSYAKSLKNYWALVRESDEWVFMLNQLAQAQCDDDGKYLYSGKIKVFYDKKKELDIEAAKALNECKRMILKNIWALVFGAAIIMFFVVFLMMAHQHDLNHSTWFWFVDHLIVKIVDKI